MLIKSADALADLFAADAVYERARLTLPFLLILCACVGFITHARDYADALRGAWELGRLPMLVASLTGPAAPTGVEP